MITLTNLERDIRNVLIDIVKTGNEQETVIRYKKLADRFERPYVDIDERNRFHKLLDDINRYEVSRGRPLLSAIVVNETQMPGEGFYRLAKELRLQRPDEDNDAFAIRAREQLFEFWKNNEDPDA